MSKNSLPLGSAFPTKRFPIYASLCGAAAVLVWFAWPWLLQQIGSVQQNLFGTCSGDVTKQYQALGALLTSVTLALTVLVQYTQYVVLGKTSLQTSMEDQIERLLTQLQDLREAGFAEQHTELLRLIVAKAVRLPLAPDRQAFMAYLFRVRFTGPDYVRLHLIANEFRDDPMVMNYLHEELIPT